jgi:hypothetical protein
MHDRSALALIPLILLLLALALAGAGCSPFVAPAPLLVAETADVLAPGDYSATAVGGGGTAFLDGSGAGGGARLRVGVGSRQEIGAEALVVYTDTGGSGERWEGQHIYYGGKLSWKLGLSPYAALIAGLGGAVAGTGPAIGGDLAIIGSTRGRIVRYYGGARAFFALPVGRRFFDAGGPGGGIMPVHGLFVRVSPAVSVFLENGWPIMLGRGYLHTDADATIQEHAHIACYAALGAQFTF